MCRGTVAAPSPLQDIVYPILSEKSLLFCEKYNCTELFTIQMIPFPRINCAENSQKMLPVCRGGCLGSGKRQNTSFTIANPAGCVNQNCGFLGKSTENVG